MSVSKKEQKLLLVLAAFGKQVSELLKKNPKVAAAYRELFGREEFDGQIIQSALERYLIESDQS